MTIPPISPITQYDSW